MAFGFVVLHFKVGEGSVASRAPVDDIVALVDQPFFVKRDKHFAHSARKPVIHGETIAFPVQRRAQFAQLKIDRSP